MCVGNKIQNGKACGRCMANHVCVLYRRPVMEMFEKKNCLITTRRVKTLRDIVCHTRLYIYRYKCACHSVDQYV